MNSKMLKKVKPHWSQTEIIDLGLLYHMGARIDEMSSLLKRSPSSITNQLNRTIIIFPKQTGVQLLSQRCFPVKCSIEELYEKFVNLKEKHLQQISNKPLSEILELIRRVVPLKKVYNEGHRLKKEYEIRKTHTNQWKTVEDLCRLLKKHGKHVKPIPNQETSRLGYTYILNGKEGMASMLLKEVNKILKLNGESLVYVENITEDSS